MLCFRRDDEGRVRLFHSYDEVEAQEAMDEGKGHVPEGLLRALDGIHWRAGERWGVVQIDTDDSILRNSEATIKPGPLGPIDFDSLIEADPDPEFAPLWHCSRHEEMGMAPCSADDRRHDLKCGWRPRPR